MRARGYSRRQVVLETLKLTVASAGMAMLFHVLTLGVVVWLPLLWWGLEAAAAALLVSWVVTMAYLSAAAELGRGVADRMRRFGSQT